MEGTASYTKGTLAYKQSDQAASRYLLIRDSHASFPKLEENTPPNPLVYRWVLANQWRTVAAIIILPTPPDILIM